MFHFAQHDSAVLGGSYEINSLTSDFSSSNSATDASIFARLKLLIGSPCTISDFPPRRPTRKRENQTFLDGVTSVGTNGNAVPVVGRRVLHERSESFYPRNQDHLVSVGGL
jgi:hypothetical protein